MTVIELAGVNGGGSVRVVGIVDEGGLEVAERRVHKDPEGLRKLLGLALGIKNREPRTEPKKPRTGAEPNRNREFRFLFGS